MFVVGIGQPRRGSCGVAGARTRLKFHGADDFAQRVGERRWHRAELPFAGIRLADRQQQSGIIYFSGLGNGCRRARIIRQRRRQIARAIGRERGVEPDLLLRRECQFIRVQHGGIIKTPLQKIVGNEAGRAHRRLAQIHHRLLAIGQREGRLVVAKCNLTVHDRQDRALRSIHGQHKFRAPHPGDRAARDDLDAPRLVAMKKGEDALNQMQAALILGRGRRQHFEFG